ncbi:hypothetical protein [Erysipelothrix sp. HDW6C]|nr:hypothetical protein [Erysipelothrix sp. HDW6C]
MFNIEALVNVVQGLGLIILIATEAIVIVGVPISLLLGSKR